MKINITSKVIDQWRMGRVRHERRNIIKLLRSMVGECHFLSEFICIEGMQYELPPAFHDWAINSSNYNWHPRPIIFTLKPSRHPKPDYRCGKHIPEGVASWMGIDPIVDMEAVHEAVHQAVHQCLYED